MALFQGTISGLKASGTIPSAVASSAGTCARSKRLAGVSLHGLRVEVGAVQPPPGGISRQRMRGERVDDVAGAAHLHSPLLAPDHLVQLQLQPCRPAALEHPGGEILWRNLAVGWGEENGNLAPELELVELLQRPPEVVARADHHLHLVAARKLAEGAELDMRLVRSRSLQIHDLAHAPRHRPEGALAVRLEGHLVATVEQLLRELRQLLLQRGLPPGQADEPGRVLRHLREDLLAGHLPAAVERVLGVAVLAAQIAPREPHEYRGHAGEGRLALDAVEDLRHPHARVFIRGQRGLQSPGLYSGQRAPSHLSRAASCSGVALGSGMNVTVSRGAAASCTETSTSSSMRKSASRTVCPGCARASLCFRSARKPSTAMISSPAARPAACAGDPSATEAISREPDFSRSVAPIHDRLAASGGEASSRSCSAPPLSSAPPAGARTGLSPTPASASSSSSSSVEWIARWNHSCRERSPIRSVAAFSTPSSGRPGGRPCFSNSVRTRSSSDFAPPLRRRSSRSSRNPTMLPFR